MKALAVLIAAFAVACVTAHVQGVWDATNVGISYRNVDPKSTDKASANGQFSTDGPCGGVQTFGANGILTISKDKTTSLEMRYNGGHAASDNAFRLTMECYGTTKPTSDAGLKGMTNAVTGCTGGEKGQGTTSCPVSVTSQSSTYLLTFTWTDKTPNGQTIADGSYCTVSMLDQRDWGTCVDFQFSAADTGTPASPDLSQLNTIVDQTGTYTAPDIGPTCDKKQDGLKCCCMHGTLSLTHDTMLNTGTLAGTLIFDEDETIGCNPRNFSFPSGGYDVPMSWPLAPMQGAVGKLVSSNLILGLFDTLSVTAYQGVINLVNTAGNGNSPPRVCSNIFVNAASASTFFATPTEATTTTNGTAAAVLIPLVILGLAGLIFFLRAPIRSCLGNAGGSAGKFMWWGFGLNFFVLILCMAAVVSDHWSMCPSVYVGPWKACVSGDCQNTIDTISGGSVSAVRFFMIITQFAAWGILALPVLVHLGKLDSFKTATVTFWSLIFIGVCTFISMCVWAAFQYDTLAKYSLFGSWTPDYALGLCCLAWIVAFSSSVVVFVWKLKAGGGGDFSQSKQRAAEQDTSKASYPVPAQTAPAYTSQPAAYAPSYPGAQPLSYPTPQPLQTNQYGPPGADV